MKKWYRLPLPKHIIYLSQYIPLKALVAFFQAWPVNASTRIGAFLGRVVHFLNRTHRGIARTNLTNAFPNQLSGHRTAKIIRQVYEHFGMTFAHCAYMNRLLHKHNWSRFVKFKNLELIDGLLKRKQGIILLGAHQGNWEVFLYTMALAGYPISVVAFRMLNPLVNAMLECVRTQHSGMKVIYTQGAIEASRKALKRNELVMFLVDLTGRKQGQRVEFFGQTASTLGGPANLAFKTQSPLVPFHSYRINRSFNYEIEFHEPISASLTGHKDEDILNLTQAYTARVEDMIRQHPEQWIWFHRKWKKYRIVKP